MAHWEVGEPIVKAGLCSGGGGVRLVSCNDGLCSEPGDATSWAWGMLAPSLWTGTSASTMSADAVGIFTALFAPLAGWKRSWPWTSCRSLSLGRKAAADLSSAIASPRYIIPFIMCITLIIRRKICVEHVRGISWYYYYCISPLFACP